MKISELRQLIREEIEDMELIGLDHPSLDKTEQRKYEKIVSDSFKKMGFIEVFDPTVPSTGVQDTSIDMGSIWKLNIPDSDGVLTIFFNLSDKYKPGKGIWNIYLVASVAERRRGPLYKKIRNNQPVSVYEKMYVLDDIKDLAKIHRIIKTFATNAKKAAFTIFKNK